MDRASQPAHTASGEPDVAGIATEALHGIGALRSRTRSLEVDKARLQGENAIQAAVIAGLTAQALSLRTELARVAPESTLLESDGVFEDGSPRERSHAVYDAAYDQKIRTLGLPGEPSMYRARKAVKAD